MKRQQKSDTDRKRAEEAADDFVVRLSLATAKVMRAAMKVKRRGKKTTGHAAS